MAQSFSPDKPRGDLPFVDLESGKLLAHAQQMVEQIWRQISAGFAVTPSVAAGTNLITLTPTLHEEGAKAYSDGMKFSFKAEHTASGAVTAKVADRKGNALATVKVYKDNGRAQAGSGDIVAGRIYTAHFDSTLDGGNGGLVADTSGANINTGDVNASGTVTATGFKIGAITVVGSQGAAVADATGAGDVVAQLNALLASLRSTGIIAT
jgi:hypothetical protein